jgi:hypothetical protein
MLSTRIEKIYILLLSVIFVGIVMHAPITIAFSYFFPSDYDLVIKSWKEIIMIGALGLAIVVVTKRRMWPDILRDWLFHLIVAYVLLHVLSAVLLYQGGAATAAGFAIDLRYILYFCLVYVGVRALPRYRNLMIRLGIAGAYIVVGFAALQLILPMDILSHIGYSKDTILPYLMVDQNPNFIRVNSTLRGPNPLGAYASIVIGLAFSAFLLAKEKLRNNKVMVGVGVLIILSSVALWISYSRSALIATMIVVLIVGIVALFKKLSIRTWILLLGILLVAGGVVIANKDTSFVLNVFYHENPMDGNTTNSNEEHVESLLYGIDRLFHQPLGAGVGSTGSASLYGDSIPIIIENQYLFIAHETGWLGLILFAAIFVTILVKLWFRRKEWLSLGVFASGIGLALIGMLQPVWVDDTVSIVWWGLAAIALVGGSSARKTK